MKIIKIIPLVLVFSVLIGCVVQVRTRKFEVDESKSENKIIVGDWTILNPELIAFKSTPHVNEIPDFDTNEFEPILIAKKPSPKNGIVNSDLVIESINITFLETNECFQLFTTDTPKLFLSASDTISHKYFNFNRENRIIIPMDIVNVLFSFEAIVVDSSTKILNTRSISIYMKRHESKGLGITYGD